MSKMGGPREAAFLTVSYLVGISRKKERKKEGK